MFIGFLLVLAGGAFTWLLGASFGKAHEQRSWAEVPAKIASVKKEKRRWEASPAPEYRVLIHFDYEYEGETYRSSRFELRGNSWTGKTSKINRLLENYTKGSKHLAYVDPEEPSLAVLKLDTKASGYSIWFPLIFVVGGVGVMIGAWLPRRKVKKSNSPPTS